MANLSRRDFLKGLAASGTVVGAQMTGGFLTRMPTAIAQDMVEVTYATPGGVVATGRKKRIVHLAPTKTQSHCGRELSRSP